jgi:hypothetical protein
MYGQIQEFYTLREIPGSPSSVNLDFSFLPTAHVANAIGLIDRIFMVAGTQYLAGCLLPHDPFRLLATNLGHP